MESIVISRTQFALSFPCYYAYLPTSAGVYDYALFVFGGVGGSGNFQFSSRRLAAIPRAQPRRHLKRERPEKRMACGRAETGLAKQRSRRRLGSSRCGGRNDLSPR